MVRLYVADVKVQEILNNLSSSWDGSLPEVGLIVGQFSDQKDYIVHAMKTPIVDLKSKDDDIVHGDNETVSIKNQSKGFKMFTPDVVVERSVCIHARQVRQMLTGGLDILGMFVHSTSDDLKTSQLKYKQILQSMLKVVGKFDFLIPKADKPSDRILMHICSNTKKISCRSFNITDPKHSGTPCDLKFQKLMDLFVGLKTNFSMRTTFYVGDDQLVHCLERQIINGLNPTIKSIWNGIPVVNGNMLDDDDGDDDDSLLRKPMETFKRNEKRNKKGGDDGEEEEDDNEIKVDLLRDYLSDPTTTGVSITTCGAKILVNGTITCRAFVHEKTSLDGGIKALKLDIIKSLLTRCELVCQDLLQGEEDQDIKAVYETPIRAFACLHNSPIHLSDYLFQDETTLDSLGRFQEVLGFQGLKEEDVDQSRESIPDAEDLDQAESILNGKDPGFLYPTTTTGVHLGGNTWTNALKSFFSIPFSILVGSVASLTASYWFFSQTYQEGHMTSNEPVLS